MEIRKIRVLRGTNQWARVPVLEAEVYLQELSNLQAIEVLGHTAREFQTRAGSPVRFTGIRPMREEGVFLVAVEYEEEALGRACLDAAYELCLASIHNQPFDSTVRLRELRDLAYEVRLGPSTGAIVNAARRRGIPIYRLTSGSLVQLGHGACQRRVWTAETNETGIIAETIAQDKQLTRNFLSMAGVPTPEGRVVTDAEDAWRAAEAVGLPVVVKPQYGNQGRGVATDLSTQEQVVRAYAAAREEGDTVVVERFIPGVDFRLLVVGDHVVAASCREPAHVIGDGQSTVTSLVAKVNMDPRRSDGHATALSFIKLDTIGLAVLAEQGYTPESVPPAGKRVLLRRNGNLSTGGTAEDVTDKVHPAVAARAVDAARVTGLDIAGVDVVAIDIGRPLESQGGAIVEVNAGPGLRMHLEPSSGQPRDPGEAIVEMLFPAGRTGRIPIVAVAGGDGDSTTARLVAHILRSTGCFVGLACSDELFLDGRRTGTQVSPGPDSARLIMLNPRVEAAVLETSSDSLLNEGLGFDRCDVGVVTNIGESDLIGSYGIETREDLAQVNCTVVRTIAPGGAAVLNADEPLVADMAGQGAGSVTYFTRHQQSPILAAHRASGGRAVFVRDDTVVLATGMQEEELISLARVSRLQTEDTAFSVESVLAAMASAWSMGISVEVIRVGLESFTGNANEKNIVVETAVV